MFKVQSIYNIDNVFDNIILLLNTISYIIYKLKLNLKKKIKNITNHLGIFLFFYVKCKTKYYKKN